MLFTNDRRLAAEICRALLAVAGIAHLWADEGPSAAIDKPLVGADESADAARRFVQSIWSGDAHQSVSELLSRADANFLIAVGTLLVAGAYGDDSLRDWLEVQNDGDRKREEKRDTTVH